LSDAASDGEQVSIWQRLRRRKIVQWGIAYAAGAWGLLQGLEYVSGTFDWPRQIQQLTTLALLIGLPIVLVVAWYHGDRGEQRVKAAELVIITLLFLLGGGLFWRYQQAIDSTSRTDIASRPAITPQAASATMRDSRPSVAVLPFKNRSAKRDDIYFADGMQDDILTQLTKVGALRVIARTSVEKFRDTELTTREIGTKLGVRAVLEGGVQRAGGRVRINVQLIDANTDSHLWAETYDRELSAADIFAIQSEVAFAVSNALNAVLTGAEKARLDKLPTRNLAAWEAYQLGDGAGPEEAEQFYRRAIALDPGFALAYVRLARVLIDQIYLHGTLREANLTRAETAVQTALQLDPRLPEAWTLSGTLAFEREQDDRAESNYRKAIELNPNYAHAYEKLGDVLLSHGRWGEARKYAEKALALDPMSIGINETIAVTLKHEGRFDEAEAVYRRMFEIEPRYAGAYVELGRLQAHALNRYADAVPLLEKAIEQDPGEPSGPVTLALLYLDLADDAAASQLLKSAERRWPGRTSVYVVSALLYAMEGRQDECLRYARKALDLTPGNGYAQGWFVRADLAKGNYAAARARLAITGAALLTPQAPTIDAMNYDQAIELANILLKTGEAERARLLLDRSEQVIRTMQRMGPEGYGIADVQIHMLRGDKAKALAALRAAAKAGWRGGWRYFRDVDPLLESIRREPEFKAVFSDIERDMARQRAELAARPPDALPAPT
jgi:TolB-like protein/Tfp pilus assembly protein PilF